MNIRTTRGSASARSSSARAGFSSSGGGWRPPEGLWAIPGGGLRIGETLQEGAEREILEETGIVIRAGAPVFTCDSFQRDGEGRVRFHYVIVDMIADYVSGDVKAADDALDARWLSPAEIRNLSATKTTLKLLRQIGFMPPDAAGDEAPARPGRG